MFLETVGSPGTERMRGHQLLGGSLGIGALTGKTEIEQHWDVVGVFETNHPKRVLVQILSLPPPYARCPNAPHLVMVSRSMRQLCTGSFDTPMPTRYTHAHVGITSICPFITA